MEEQIKEMPVSKKSLAAQLNISGSTINRYMKKGMPFKHKGFKKLEFNLTECKNWLYSRKK